MWTFTRPHIAPVTFRDAAGDVIPYGSRWPDMPPEDTYSVESNLERFAPLHTYADALIAHLTETYDASAVEDPPFTNDLIWGSDGVTRVVRVTPNDPAASPIMFAFTDYPGIRIRMGYLIDLGGPRCGCEACDETWESTADELERHVEAAVAGGFSERLIDGAEPRVETAITFRDGSSIGESGPDGYPPFRFAAAVDALRTAPGWAAWPLRP